MANLQGRAKLARVLPPRLPDDLLQIPLRAFPRALNPHIPDLLKKLIRALQIAHLAINSGQLICGGCIAGLDSQRNLELEGSPSEIAAARE